MSPVNQDVITYANINPFSVMIEKINIIIRLLMTWFIYYLLIARQQFVFDLVIKCFVKLQKFQWELIVLLLILICFILLWILIVWINSTKTDSVFNNYYIHLDYILLFIYVCEIKIDTNEIRWIRLILRVTHFEVWK